MSQRHTRTFYKLLWIILVVFILQFILEKVYQAWFPEKYQTVNFMSFVYRFRIKELITHVQNNGSYSSRSPDLPGCPRVPKPYRRRKGGGYRSPLPINEDVHTMEDVIRLNTDILPGGAWKPRDCLARHRLAVIIPYRDRHHHLIQVLSRLLPVLKRQQLDFRIYVTEQYGNLTFNKGLIMNAAYIEALKARDWHCFAFHDVDLIPENDSVMYTCPPEQPRHLSVAVDEQNYILDYDTLVGGVMIFRTEHFKHVNGYSNMYWGWGSEDDDMALRINSTGLRISRPPINVGRFKMIKHKKRTPALPAMRFGQLKTAKQRRWRDGLSSAKYRLKEVKSEPLYTHFMVDVGKPPGKKYTYS